jgi:hypothetical protein
MGFAEAITAPCDWVQNASSVAGPVTAVIERIVPDARCPCRAAVEPLRPAFPDHRGGPDGDSSPGRRDSSPA